MRIAKAFVIAVLCLFVPIIQAQVPVSISPAPRLQFLDANGHPLAGGCVFTYVAGTSTPLATYIDSGGVFQNANPTILDASGFASIWLTNVAYDIAVFSAGGVNCASGTQQYKTLNINSNTALLNAPNVWSGLQTFNGGISGTGSLGTLTAGAGILATQNVWLVNQSFPIITSTNANPALTGFLRLAKGDAVSWRNQANTSDLDIGNNAASGNMPADTLSVFASGFSSPFLATSLSGLNFAASGGFRLSAGDGLCWRNQANSGDVCITKNASDAILAPGLGGVKKECANVTPVTVGNTVTPTLLQTCNIPASDIAVGSEFSIDVQGIVGNTAGPTLQVNVLLDGTPLSTFFPVLTTANTQPFSARIFFVGVTTGVTGSVTGASLLWESTASGGGTASLITSNASGVGNPPQFVTIDTTISHVLSLQVTWGTANALNTITSNVMVVSRLN